MVSDFVQRLRGIHTTLTTPRKDLCVSCSIPTLTRCLDLRLGNSYTDSSDWERLITALIHGLGHSSQAKNLLKTSIPIGLSPVESSWRTQLFTNWATVLSSVW